MELIRKAWALSGFLQVEINYGENLVELIDGDKSLEISMPDARELARLIMRELPEGEEKS